MFVALYSLYCQADICVKKLPVPLLKVFYLRGCLARNRLPSGLLKKQSSHFNAVHHMSW